MLSTLVLIVAMTSGDVSATVQAEKLRMNLLELREISRSQRIRDGGIYTIIGTGLLGGSIVALVNGSSQGTTSADSSARDLILGGFGVALISFGIVNLLTKPFEDESWNQLLDLHKTGPADPAVFLAEGEALFEATVQRAAFRRRIMGASMILAAVIYASLHLNSALSAPRPTAPHQHDPLAPGNYLAVEIVDLVLVALGVFHIVAVKTPTEQAWGAYINDKNTQRPLPVTLVPLVSVQPNGFIAGLQGVF